MTKNQLIAKLEREIVELKILKKDNTSRIMRCTLNKSHIPKNKIPASDDYIYGNIIRVYDVERNDWRSFDYTTSKVIS